MLIDHLLGCAMDLGFDKREITLIQEENTMITLSELAEDKFSYSKYISFIFRGLQKDKYIMFHSENCNVDTLNSQFKEAIKIQNRTGTSVSCNFNHTKILEKTIENTNKELNNLLLSSKAKEVYNKIDKKFNDMKNDESETIFIEKCCFGYLQYNSCLKNNLGFLYQRNEGYYYILLTLQISYKNIINSITNLQYNKDLSNIKIDEFISESLFALISKAKVKSIKTGRYNIVLSNKVGAQLLEAFSPIFFAENIQVGHSCLRDMIGQNVASSVINLYDSGQCNYSSHVVEYDYEGTKVDDKILIENGVLKNFLYNSYTVPSDSKTTGGNSFMHDNLMGTNITNFFIKPSDINFKDLLNIKYGLLITEMSDLDGLINFTTGDISVAISGFEIVNGEIRNAFGNAIMNSNICDIFQRVIAIDSEIYFTMPDNIGSVGVPNMLVEGISITHLT